MMIVMEKHMVCTSEHHNKFYILQMIRDGATYVIKTAWGRIGKTKREQVKYEGGFQYEARHIFNKVLNTRREHGYTEV